MSRRSKFQDLPREKKVLFRASKQERPFHLHCILLGGGHEALTPQSTYDFDGLKRGERYFCNIQYTLAGRGVLEQSKQKYDLKEGSLFLTQVPSNHRYYLPREYLHSSPKKTTWEFIYLTLSGSEVERICCQILQLAKTPVFTLNCELERELWEILQALLIEGINDMLFYSGKLYQFLLRLLAEQIQKNQELQKIPVKVQCMKEYIREHFQEDVIIADIARIVDLSETYSMNLFKRHTGQTLRQYLESLRLTHAQNLLRYSRRSIREVASLSGFKDSNYFSKVFYKHFGVKPNKARN